MLRIRLSRVGKKKQPSYRLVVTDRRNPRDGANVEIVGHIDPLTNPATVTLKEDRIVHWLKVGAQPSETAAKLLTKAGVMELAGKAPVVYKGKEVPRAEKGKKGAEAEASAPAPAPVAAAAPAVEAAAPDEPAAEPEATADEATAEAAPAEPPEEAETPTEDTETTD